MPRLPRPAGGPAPSPTCGRRPAVVQGRDIYQLHVKAFFDANYDGVGDLGCRRSSITCRIGVTALWLLPFYPSPCATTLRHRRYRIHPTYGRMAIPAFIRATTEDAGDHRLVINHTSDQHCGSSAHGAPSWIAARFLRVERHRQEFLDTRSSFSYRKLELDADPVANYYWHRHQPVSLSDNRGCFAS